VIFDPTIRRAGSTELNGWYLYDDEGVQRAARRWLKEASSRRS
jgi:hypothetical protein